MKESERKQTENYLKQFVELHEEIKYALEMKNNVLAMKLLEQCQATALKLGNLIEAVKGRNFDTILTLDDYCQLVYIINEDIWHKYYINSGKIYRYLNKSLRLIEESINLDTRERG